MERKIERLSRTYLNGAARLSPRALLTLLAAACMAACAPIVTHGPRVEQGVTFYGTLGGSRKLCDFPDCDTLLVPQLGAGLRYGHAASASAPGLSAGLTVSAGWVSSELDLYAQAPIGFTPFDAGTGVLLSPAHVMPYVQAGRMQPDGSGWYTTQGFAFVRSRSPDFLSSDIGPERVKPRYWAPTIAYRTRGRYGVHFYVSGAFGTAETREHRGAEPGFRTGRQPVRAVMVGMVFDVRPAHRSPRQVPPPPAPIPAAPPPAAQPR